MSNAVGTIEQLAGELARIFNPLAQRIEDNTADSLLQWLGLRPSDAIAGSANLDGALTASAAVAASLEKLVNDLAQAIEQDNENTIASSTAALLQSFGTIIQGFNDAADALHALSADPGLTAQQQAEITAFANVFVERLLNRLFVEYLEARFPLIALVLIVVGAIEIVEEEAGPVGSLNGPYTRKAFHLERMMKLFSDPTGLLRDVYQWGNSGFDGLALFATLQTLLREKFGIPAEILRPPGAPAILEAFGFNAEVNPGLTPPGLDVSLRMPASIDSADTINEGDWQVKFDGHVSVDIDLEATLRPFFDVELHLPTGKTVDLNAMADFSRSTNAAPFLLLGSAGGSRVEVKSPHASLRLEQHFDSTSLNRARVEPAVEFKLGGAQAVLDFSQADGFLAQIFPKDGLTVPFDLTGGWSISRGFYFQGGAGLETTVSVNLDLFGILKIDSLYLAFQVGEFGNATGVEAVIAATAAVSLGPVTAVVERMGLAVTLRFPSRGGNLGAADLALGFKPPNGLGLSIDAPVVVGGGFLFFDTEKEEYGGILQLEVAETIAVKGIGLLTTRMPDGSKGFSLVILISAEGFAPIQLGFGFTLTGVGGLLGVNRTVKVDVLRGGIKNGTLGSILFPPDPIRNAPQIVSDLRAVFPPVKERYLLGPMAIIGWGTPTLLTLELALILEIPEPIRLLILGRLTAILPEERTALVRVRMDALGVIEFTKGEVSLDAVLYDSRILEFTLTGEMALRASWGDEPSFVLAIGGFNPRFLAPAGFPRLERLALSLSDGDDLRLRCECYLALTSNTVQFGARLDLHAAGGGFTLDGYLGIDALFHFEPFEFVVDIGAGVALRYHGHLLMGISLEGTLSGPTPWQIRGKATFKVLFFKVSVSVNHRFGVDEPGPLPAPVDVLTLLVGAVRDARNWSSELRRGEHPLVTFGEGSGGASLRAHPRAELVVRQRVVPLNVTIARFGNAPVSGENRFTLAAVRADGGGGELPLAATMLQDAFALGQYLEMDDDEKLSRPSFEGQDAGLRLGSEEVSYQYDSLVDGEIEYETQLVVPGQAPQEDAPSAPRYVMAATVLEAVAVTGAAGQAAIRRSGNARYRTLQLVA
jgi:hypothetical protein